MDSYLRAASSRYGWPLAEKRRPPNLASVALRQYGRFRGRLIAFHKGQPASSPELRVELIGQFSERKMTDLLRAFFAISPPDLVYVTTKRRNDRPSPRPAVRLTWYGPAAQCLLDATGWTTGNPKLDAKLAAWQRWLKYRRASHGTRYD